MLPPNQAKNLMQPFPLSDDALHEIWLKLAYWLVRYTILNVWMDNDDRRRMLYHCHNNTSLEPSAQVD